MQPCNLLEHKYQNIPYKQNSFLSVAKMAATNSSTQPAEPPPPGLTAEELAAKAVHKRYEGLVMVRTKAIKGKGAWYWAHLEPVLVNHPETGLAKAVKLRCSLCDALFSASNPSRTASEHLKRGTCPNFVSAPKPISSVSPSSMPALASPSSSSHHRKRSSSPYQVPPLAIVDPSRFTALSVTTVVTASASAGGGSSLYSPQQQHLILSGGKKDFGALAMLEDSVKKLKSPKPSPSPVLSKNQIDSALDNLAEWVYQSCGSVSFSGLDHPKFKAFLSQVGLPAVSPRDFAGARLNAKYEEAKAASEARILDAMFFQISSDGWKSKNYGLGGEENLVNLAVNLPNGTSVFRKAVFTTGSVPSNYAEELLWDTIRDTCENSLQQCVGIVADKFKAKALKSLESQHPWMVNLSCQFQAFSSLIKDFIKELPLFKNVTENCLKLANFVNSKTPIRNAFRKYQFQEYGQAGLLRVPHDCDKSNFGPLHSMVEDILSYAQALQLVVLDEEYKTVSMEDQIAREVEDMTRDPHFWNELEAVHSLVKLIKGMAQEIETERPLVGQCIPLWDELRGKVKDWCSRFHIAEASVEKLVDRRFRKNYHPAWAAAFILDPLYLIRDTSGKYLPPFKCLTPDQEKDVDKLITRLVSREEAHIVLMEFMKWRTEGLDPVYAQAVQFKQRDPITGKMKVANPQSSRLVWETHLTQFKSLGKVAVRLIFLHATSCGFKCNFSFLRWVNTHGCSRVGMERAQKLIFIAAHSRLERREVSNNEEKDAELFTLTNGEDDVFHEVFIDASSV
ncbi:LOW QUALITY PROTEIN: uncharacterized protein LOC127787694 [Diospyros lotus]|uniref:LOW QUALITY PROTEIN: uncharacterized protein LOC127787694 n=1 Tax=Diospyros lotus TaxID=55363 RepID=UPI00225629A3|nr:LOW QUALITY PROTEIN: uncharacterized protein LOC127787694 [Diospyros lotus]